MLVCLCCKVDGVIGAKLLHRILNPASRAKIKKTGDGFDLVFGNPTY